jgi:[CysO sulfur-carrier protein]-S-L-cysteine hydrolase
MKILLAAQIVRRLHRELRRAGTKEIGGLLMGEDLGDGAFRVVDISVQRSGGTHACFIRNPQDHKVYLEAFFTRTGRDYTRFNYLGEWHSHPSFEASPSGTDITTMQSIVSDPDVGVNFLTLLIAKRSGKQIEATATVFMVAAAHYSVPVLAEPDEKNQGNSHVSKWLKRIFSS